MSDRCVVSNSLHLLCAYLEFTLDTQYAGYEADFNTIVRGINKYKNKVRVINNQDEITYVELYYFRNLRIDDNGNVEITIKPQVTPFNNFNDYYDRLKGDMVTLAENARDKERNHEYGIVTTISKGYDAPCCAAIAKKMGCDNAVTFKAVGKYAEDSGKEVATQLGYMNVIEEDANSFYKKEGCVESIYISSGEICGASFDCFSRHFRDNLVLMGDRGDSVWSIKNSIVNNEFQFEAVLSHLSLSEAQLWIGYIHVPVPLYGASQWESIQRISQSEEMRKWSLGNNYDRPIPRRIVETAGVDRNIFGQTKHGAGFFYRYDWLERILKRMSVASAESFRQYVREKNTISFKERVDYLWKAKNIFLNRIGIPVKSISLAEAGQIINNTEVRYLIPWAAEIIRNKYKQGLESEL